VATMRRTVPVIDVARLHDLPTQALLARLDRLRKLEPSAASSYWTAAEIAAIGNDIAVKDTPQWQTAYDNVRAELGERGHDPAGPDRRRARVERAKLKAPPGTRRRDPRESGPQSRPR
jgi:hypothetical protein